MQIVNLTEAAIVVVDPNSGAEIETFAPSGNVAQVDSSLVEAESIGNVPTYKIKRGKVALATASGVKISNNLAAQDGVLYIVDREIADLLPQRADLLTTYVDESGSCVGLIRNGINKGNKKSA